MLSPGCPSPTVPIDMAIRICLASSPPVRSFVGNLNGGALLKHCEPLRPCLSASVAVATTTSATVVVDSGGSSSSPTWKNRRKKKKKNVVFADCLGLALTAVHVFDEAEENLLTELQFQLTEIEGAATRLHLGEEAGERLVLHRTVGQFRESLIKIPPKPSQSALYSQKKNHLNPPEQQGATVASEPRCWKKPRAGPETRRSKVICCWRERQIQNCREKGR